MPTDFTRRILPTHEAFYIEIMRFNSEQATRAISTVNTIIHVVFENSPENPVAAIPVNRVLNELQTFIIHSASLSRFLWPVRQNHYWRGNQIRESLNISEGNALQSRELRNAIEHFDEKLDGYLEGDTIGYVLPQYVGFSPGIQEVPHHFLRAYYIDISVFELLGRQYEVIQLSKAVLELDKKLSNFAKFGGRLPSIDLD